MNIWRINFLIWFIVFSPASIAGFKFENNEIKIENFESEINFPEAIENNESYQTLRKYNIDIGNNVITTRVRNVWYFSKQADVQDLGQGRIKFNDRTQSVTLLSAATVLKNKKIHYLMRKDVKQVDSNTYNVFSSGQELLVNFPKLEVGGYSVLEYEIRTDKTKMEYDWSSIMYPQTYYPTGEFQLSVKWAKGFKPNITLASEYLKCTEQELKINCSAFNIPGVRSDKNIYIYDKLGFVGLGDRSSWGEVVSHGVKLFEDSYTKTPNIFHQFLFSKLGRHYSKTDAIDFIHDYVARKIRYLSKSEHGHAVRPHNTNETMNSLIGDCKDKTALFVNLAKLAGINAYPVLVSTYRQELNEKLLPSLRLFNHAIACYSHEGEEYCSDLTDAESHWKNTSSWVQGKYALRLVEGSQPHLLMSDKYRWKFNVSSDITMLKNGGQVEKQTRTYENMYSAWYKGKIAGKNKEELQLWLEDEYKRVVGQGSSQEILINGLGGRTSANVVIESETEYASFLNVTEELSYIEPDAWILSEIADNTPSNKLHGEQMVGLNVTSQYVFHFSPFWNVTIKPANLNLKHHFGRMIRSSSIKSSGQVVVDTTLSLPRIYLKKGEVEEYREFLNELKSQLNIRVFGVVKSEE